MHYELPMHKTNLALLPWTTAQNRVLRSLASLRDLMSARACRLPTLTVDNAPIFTAMAVGFFIGLGAATLFIDQLAFALGHLLPLWSIAVLQLSMQPGSKLRQREQRLLQHTDEPFRPQQGQSQTGTDGKLCVTTSIPDDETMTVLVEGALRHLYDCSYLGQHPLVQLRILERQPPSYASPGLDSHLDLGRALHSLLIDIIERLRPPGPLPTSAVIPPREWHPYLILHASYVQGQRTREIMAWLCIGEGTYSRTRRRALHSVAKAIQEIEHQRRIQSGCS